MKKGVIFFHKDIRSIYPRRWVEKCINSILSQNDKEFKIYEINYGGEEYSVFEDIQTQQEREFYSQEFTNHAEAMNFILDQAFRDGCECVFNTNLDDFYSPDRISKQASEIEKGSDLVSSNMCYVEEKGIDMNLKYFNFFEMGDIENNLKGGNNIIAHPSVAFSRRFWESNRYNPEEIPMEDFLLWKRSISSGFKFSIVNDYLLSYRLHSSQVTGDNSGGAAFLRNSPTPTSVNPTLIR